MVRAAAVLLAALAAACASTPAPGPAGADSAVLAVRIRTLSKSDGAWGSPQTVHFVRLENAKADFGKVRQVVPSNYTQGNIAYLLDAAPGRYYAVACTEKVQGKEYSSFFSRELIGRTGTDVSPGAFAFMGDAIVHVIRSSRSIEPVQRHYIHVIEPDWTRRNLATQIFARSRVFLGNDYEYRREEPDVVARAHAHLAESGWKFE